MNVNKANVVIFTSFSGDGGVEKMIVNLCEGFLHHGSSVTLLLARDNSKHLSSLPNEVKVVKFPCSHTLTSLPYLVRYLKQEKPNSLLIAKHRSNQLAVMAKKLSRVATRLVARVDTTISAALESKGQIRKILWYPMMRYFYRQLDAVIAVSQGVAEDVCRIADISPRKVTAVPNPVIFKSMFVQANEPIDHPWFGEQKIPVLLGIGRLNKQKDFHTLVRAFAKVREGRPCRLVILGEGDDRSSLQKLSEELCVSADVDLHGFVLNPYAYLKQSNLFVLSSVWEGSPTVLTEALALGVPVVATDCPSGPREILRNGEIAPLVPMRDPAALADAILLALETPPSKDILQAAAKDYTIEASSLRHLEILNVPDPGNKCGV